MEGRYSRSAVGTETRAELIGPRARFFGAAPMTSLERSDPIDPPSGGFPTTIWSQVRGAADGAQRRERLEDLARRYQGPAEAFLRAAAARDADEARDLFQAFFVHLLESDLLARVDPARGRFRAFLKVALRHFATDAHRRRTAARRGGGADAEALDAAEGRADPRGEAPEEALDRAWRATLMAEALERTRAALEADGRATVFAVFRDYYLDGARDLDYRALAARHGITTTDVSNFLMRAKRAWRAELRRGVLDTVSSAGELDDELRWLIGEDA